MESNREKPYLQLRLVSLQLNSLGFERLSFLPERFVAGIGRRLLRHELLSTFVERHPFGASGFLNSVRQG